MTDSGLDDKTATGRRVLSSPTPATSAGSHGPVSPSPPRGRGTARIRSERLGVALDDAVRNKAEQAALFGGHRCLSELTLGGFNAAPSTGAYLR